MKKGKTSSEEFEQSGVEFQFRIEFSFSQSLEYDFSPFFLFWLNLFCFPFFLFGHYFEAQLDALIPSGHTVFFIAVFVLDFLLFISFCCYFVLLLAFSTLSSQLVGPFLLRGLPTKRQSTCFFSPIHFWLHIFTQIKYSSISSTNSSLVYYFPFASHHKQHRGRPVLPKNWRTSTLVSVYLFKIFQNIDCLRCYKC